MPIALLSLISNQSTEIVTLSNALMTTPAVVVFADSVSRAGLPSVTPIVNGKKLVPPNTL
jgi:hypothetical protein